MASVLIVDDDPPIRSLLMAVAQRAGHQVRDARSSQQAIELLREGDFDVLLLDLMMPQVSGFDMLELLRKEKPHKIRCVIVLTALSDKNLNLSDFHGVFRVLRKPFDLNELLKAISGCVAQKQ